MQSQEGGLDEPYYVASGPAHGLVSEDGVANMRILIICYLYPPEVAPAGLMVRELAEDLAAAGHDVTVLTGWPSHPKGTLYKGWRARFRQVQRDPKGFKVIRCGHALRPRFRPLGRLWYYLTFALSSFINGLATGRIDAIYNDSTPIFGVFSAWLLSKCKGARVVYSIHDLFPESARNAGLMREGLVYRLLRAQDAWLCRHSDVVVTLSENMKRGIEARGVNGEKVRVVPLWLDPRKVTPRDRDNPWRRSQGIPPETFVALYAGTIGYISGAEILLDAAQALRDREDILLLVVGEGPVKETLRSRSAEMGLTNMRFLPFQPAELLPDMQATGDVGLVTLLPEAGETSVPSKVLGYLAAGRGVIASVRQGCPTERVLREGHCGVVVPPQDGVALAQAIRRAADDKECIRRWGRNARALFERRFNRDRCTQQYAALLACERGKRSTGRAGR